MNLTKILAVKVSKFYRPQGPISRSVLRKTRKKNIPKSSEHDICCWFFFFSLRVTRHSRLTAQECSSASDELVRGPHLQLNCVRASAEKKKEEQYFNSALNKDTVQRGGETKRG